MGLLNKAFDIITPNQVGKANNRVSDLYGDSGDFNSVNTDSATINGNTALEEGGKSDNSPGFGTNVQVSSTRPAVVIVTCQAKTDGTNRAMVQLAVDEDGDGTGDELKTIARQAPTGSGDASQSTAAVYLSPGEEYFIKNTDNPNNGNRINSLDEVTL